MVLLKGWTAPVVKALRLFRRPQQRRVERAVRPAREGAVATTGQRAELSQSPDSPAQVQAEDPAGRMIQAVLRLEQHTAREIMVPRIDVSALDVNSSLQEAVEMVLKEGYSRIPVYEETIDSIVGVLSAKDLLPHRGADATKDNLLKLVRKPYFIPESKKLDELLRELQSQRVHMAIVVDEYGGTAGLVALEDLLEEIVGEIYDEFDVVDPLIIKLSDTESIVDARASLETVNQTLALHLQGEDVDTIGGFVYHFLGKIPSVDDTIDADQVNIKVLSLSGRGLRKLKLTLPLPR